MKAANFAGFWNSIKTAASAWQEDGAQRLGAALAYYSLFSMGPLLLIAISIAGLVFGREAVSGELFAQLRGLIGDQGAEAVATLLKSTHEPAKAGWASALGFATLLFGATGVIVELKDSLNLVWHVKAKPGRGLRIFLRKYVVSLAAVMGFGFLLMVSLVASALLSAASTYFSNILPMPAFVLHAATFLVSMTAFTALIAGVFKYLPDVHLKFLDVLPGAATTTLLFLIGKTLIGLYLGREGFSSAFGAAGSLIVIVIWVYYSAQIIFFGAELTAALYRKRYGRIEVRNDAEWVGEKEGFAPA